MTRKVSRSVGAFAMKTNFKVLMLFGMCAFASLADAATTTFDLRTAPNSPSARLLSASAGSCLQTATLPAGATAAGALSVGDTLTFLLFKDTEIHVTLSERMESPLGGEAFIGTVSGYDGVKHAGVLQTADGLTVDIQDFARNRTYTIVSDANGVTVKEIDPSRDIVTRFQSTSIGTVVIQRLPSAPTTLWQGMISEMGLCPTAPPTARAVARAAPDFPATLSAISP